MSLYFLSRLHIPDNSLTLQIQNASVQCFTIGVRYQFVLRENLAGIDTGNGVIQCPAFSEITLLTSTFMHGGLIHLGGNLLFLWIFGDNIEQKFGKIKYLGIYLMWGVTAGLIHIFGDVRQCNSSRRSVWCNFRSTGCISCNFPKGPNSNLHDAWFLLENDAHSG